jgi:hypothetical protein
MKRPRTVDVTLYGCTGTGATRTEAKARAAARIACAFTDDWRYNPEIVRFPRGEIATVYRTLEGWTYGILWAADTAKTLYGTGCFLRKEDAMQALRRHVAQGYWDDGATEGGQALLSEGDTTGKRAQAQYATWQHIYQALGQLGHDADTCHRLACGYGVSA